MSKIITLAMAFVAIMLSVSLATTPVVDSVQISNALNSTKVYVLVTQSVADSLARNGNPTAALIVSKALTAKEKNRADSLLTAVATQKAVDDSIAAVQQSIADSLAAAKEKENFWPNVQKATAEIPEDFDSVLFWADTPVKVAAVLLKYDVPRTWVEANLSNIDGDGEEVITAAVMNYNQTRNMLRRYAVELGGPAHRKLLGQDSLLISNLDETNVSLNEAREAVELTFEMSTSNAGNIQLLAADIDGLKRSVWTCLEALKRTKIRKSQADDNRQMLEALTAQSTTAVVPIQLKSTEL